MRVIYVQEGKLSQVLKFLCPISVSHTGQQLTSFEIRLEQYLLLKVNNQGRLCSHLVPSDV